jgi:hypothetical protein
MSILSQLSSQVGDRSEASNRKVVRQCLENPALLDEIAVGLKQQDAALLGDCAEVLTMVAEQHPDWVAPHAGIISTLLIHKNTRVRWEAMHALALITTLATGTIMALVPLLVQLIRQDKSVIVRDHAVDALANYASTGQQPAYCVYPYLKETLTLWDGKQAAHALEGLVHVARLLPDTRPELRDIAVNFSASERPVVRKAAKVLLNQLDSE